MYKHFALCAAEFFKGTETQAEKQQSVNKQLASSQQTVSKQLARLAVESEND